MRDLMTSATLVKQYVIVHSWDRLRAFVLQHVSRYFLKHNLASGRRSLTYFDYTITSQSIHTAQHVTIMWMDQKKLNILKHTTFPLQIRILLRIAYTVTQEPICNPTHSPNAHEYLLTLRLQLIHRRETICTSGSLRKLQVFMFDVFAPSLP